MRLAPNRTENAMLEAKLRHFEVFFHGVTSAKLEVKEMEQYVNMKRL